MLSDYAVNRIASAPTSSTSSNRSARATEEIRAQIHAVQEISGSAASSISEIVTKLDAIHGAQARGLQARGLKFPDGRGATVQPGFDLVRKIVFIHSVIPFDLRIFANAWVAREQCVFTLPSEHPITLAVSLTSSSSQ